MDIYMKKEILSNLDKTSMYGMIFT